LNFIIEEKERRGNGPTSKSETKKIVRGYAYSWNA